MLLVKDLFLEPSEDEALLAPLLERRLGTAAFRMRIFRRSIDARKRLGKDCVRLNYQCVVEMEDARLEKRLSALPTVTTYAENVYRIQKGHAAWPEGRRPVVVGLGPAGLFAAYLLAREGYRPLVLERGQALESRSHQVEAFWAGERALDPENNVQFGEGGAGAFSDGKLTSRSKDPRQSEVLRILHENGADAEVLFQNKAHIGTDRLKPIVQKMRERMLDWGAELRFGCRFEGLIIDAQGRWSGVRSTQGSVACDRLVLAPGHSARDTFRQLLKQGLAAEAKAFAVGFRIEHPQAWVDRTQYGVWAGAASLGAASYQLSVRLPSTLQAEGRGVYSFCMCPGGRVIAASSAAEALVVNGMSSHARDLSNANSALLVDVRPGRDFTDRAEGALCFQEGLEREAYRLGQGAYCAPVETLGHFLSGAVNQPTTVWPSYTPSWRSAELGGLLPAELRSALQAGIQLMDRKMPGFARPDALLTAVESRSSSPLRFLRDPNSLEAEGFSGLFPCGEGAGYAGGIVSSAIDGLRVAEKIIAGRAALVTENFRKN